MQKGEHLQRAAERISERGDGRLERINAKLNEALEDFRRARLEKERAEQGFDESHGPETFR